MDGTTAARAGAIEIVSAGAGSGKTHRITGIVRDAVRDGLAPEAILATTFTKKAAAELVERARVRLLQEGLSDEAAWLVDSLVGTVNSVCGRLLEEYAFDAGLPPALTVLSAADQPAAFATAVASVIEDCASEMEPVAHRLGCTERAIRRPNRPMTSHAKEWRAHVHGIVGHSTKPASRSSSRPGCP